MRIVLLSIGLFGLSSAAHATDLTVCASGCNHTTIQAAINALGVNTSDATVHTITVDGGDYNEGLVIDDRTVDIQGENGEVWTLTDTSAGQGIEVKGTSVATVGDFILPSSGNKGLRVRENEGASGTFEDCEINQRNDGDHGGGAKIEGTGGTTATFRRCTFDSNDIGNSKDGGAILAKANSVVTVESCTFTGNYAEDGGAIRIEDTASMSITGSTFTGDNSETNGGAIDVVSTYDGSGTYSHALVVENTSFTGTHSVNGGAIRATGSVKLTDVGFNGTYATDGGAIRTTGLLEIAGGHFGRLDPNNNGSARMDASNRGGAIFGGDGAKILITESSDQVSPGTVFHDTRADTSGGAIWFYPNGASTTDDVLEITGATFDGSDNNNNGAGGGCLRQRTGLVTITDTDFVGCDAGDNGGAIRVDLGGDLFIVGGSFTDNLSADDAAGIFGIDSGTVVDIEGTTFTRNAAIENGANGDGGAIRLEGGSELLSVVGATFTDNKAGGVGGDIFMYQSTELYIEDTTFTGSQSGESNGADSVAVSSGGDVTLVDNTWTNNVVRAGAVRMDLPDLVIARRNTFCSISESDGSGGAAIQMINPADAAGTHEFTNNLFAFTDAGSSFGAMHITGGANDEVEVINNTFINTQGDNGVGGLDVDGAEVWVINNLFAYSENYAVGFHSSAIYTLEYNLFYMNDNDAEDGSAIDLSATTNITSTDPLLANYVDGVTGCGDIEAYPGDPGSPLLDNGDPAIWDDDPDNTDRSDIGYTGGPDADPALRDSDGDGFPAGPDCDDSNPAIFPGAAETCNDVDDDCDGPVDEGGIAGDTWYIDSDDDGYGDENATAVNSCLEPTDGLDYAQSNDDCDDSDPNNYPTNPEICDGDGSAGVQQDNDCDATTNPILSLYYVDGDLDGVGGTTQALFCSNPGVGFSAGTGDCDDSDGANYPGNDEVCEGDGSEAVQRDNNCDDDYTDGLNFQTYYPDSDDDNYGDDTATGVVYCISPGSTFVTNNGDCDDNDSNNFPGNMEVCEAGPDGSQVDNDCDNLTDEGLSFTAYFPDGDGDGFGDDTDPGDLYCNNPGSGFVANNGDCNDAQDFTYSGADELCDTFDNDCDSTVDENPIGANSWYADGDGDSYGDANDELIQCEQPTGYVLDDTDCDDVLDYVYPGADELCDGGNTDEDCDNTIDENGAVDATTWYHDGDGDDYGDADDSEVACTPPADHVADNTDCDDGRDTVNPAAPETCNNRDDDCNGVEDDGPVSTGGQAYYQDLDGDTYGDPNATANFCDQPQGYVTNDRDCDDTLASVNPDAIEVCGDGVDADCDGAGGPNDDDDNDGISFAQESLACEYIDQGGTCTATGFCASDCDTDSDDDGVPDAIEWGTTGMNTDADCTQDIMDFDDDGDGIATFDEGDNDVDGQTGRGGGCFDPPLGVDEIPDETSDGIDDDNDGLIDENVGQRVEPDGLPNYLDTDSDGDGIPDAVEIANPDPDADDDGIPDFLDCDDTDGCEGDGDGDGISNCDERDVGMNPADPDSDNDGLSDWLEWDNGNLPDSDGDTIPDAIDPDDDNDGVPTAAEGDADGDPTNDDTDNDSIPDYLDDDDDGDGMLTSTELEDYVWPNDGTPPTPPDGDCDGIANYLDDQDEDGDCGDADGDGLENLTEDQLGTDRFNVDSDGDGIFDGDEVGDPANPTNTDGDTDIDALDTDDDGDGIETALEGAYDVDEDGVPNYLDDDSDGDGTPDGEDGLGDDDCDGAPNFLDPFFDDEGGFCDTADLPTEDTGGGVITTDDGGCGCALNTRAPSAALVLLVLAAAGRRRRR